MKLIDALAADYWIENTARIYEEDLHVSSPVMDAYKAGFEKAKELIIAYELRLNPKAKWTEISIEELKLFGSEEE